VAQQSNPPDRLQAALRATRRRPVIFNVPERPLSQLAYVRKGLPKRHSPNHSKDINQQDQIDFPFFLVDRREKCLYPSTEP
jgi:hypothetical protein